MNIDFVPGVYTLRSASISSMSQHLFDQWITGARFTEFPSLLWISTQTDAALHGQIAHRLNFSDPKHRGFNLIAIDPNESGQGIRGGADQLVDLLSNVLVFHPALIIIEDLKLWLGAETEPLARRNPSLQIRFLRKWARETKATLVGLSEAELPVWAGFCDGLCELDASGHTVTEAWWKRDQGLMSTLWNESQAETDAQTELQLNAEDFPHLGALAHAVYQQRFQDGFSGWLRVNTSNPKVLSKGQVLIRLGADEVREGPAQGGNPQQVKQWDGQSLSADYTHSLQDVFTPGLLTLITTRQFATQGVMLLDLASAWGTSCVISRLSLLPHVSAAQAARLVNLSNLQSSLTITSDAFYFLRLWPLDPAEVMLDRWLSSCLNAPLPSLFAGQVHYTDQSQQLSVLQGIDQQMESVRLDELDWTMDSATHDISQVWTEADSTRQDRPWLNRMKKLLNLEEPSA